MGQGQFAELSLVLKIRHESWPLIQAVSYAGRQSHCYPRRPGYSARTMLEVMPIEQHPPNVRPSRFPVTGAQKTPMFSMAHSIADTYSGRARISTPRIVSCGTSNQRTWLDHIHGYHDLMGRRAGTWRMQKLNVMVLPKRSNNRDMPEPVLHVQLLTALQQPRG